MNFEINPNCRELIQQGKCKADCCGCVPINAGYWERVKKYVQTKDYKIFKFTHKGQKFIKAITKDCKCVFIKDDYSCAIYHTNLRPKVCYLYGTDKIEPLLACPHINKDKKEFISKAVDMVMGKLITNNDRCAKELMNRS